jgi:hypothetical protein
MAILTKGETFADAEAVTSGRLNNIVDGATWDDPVDDSTLEVSGGKLRVKDLGIQTAKLAVKSVTPSKVDDTNTDPFILRKVSIKEEASFVVNAAGTVNGSVTPVLTAGAIQIFTLSGDTTFNSPTNSPAPKGATYIWVVKQDATGGRTLTWDSVYKFPAGVAPVLTAAANAVDVFSVAFDGATYYVIQTADFK